jgi:hypothetical protein
MKACLHQLPDWIDQRRAPIIPFQDRLNQRRDFGGIQLTGTAQFSRCQRWRQSSRANNFPQSGTDLLGFAIDWFGHPVLAAISPQNRSHMLTQLISGRGHRSTPSEHIPLSMVRTAERQIVMVTLPKVVNCTGSKLSELHLPASCCLR